MGEHWINKHFHYPNDVVEPNASRDSGEISAIKTTILVIAGNSLAGIPVTTLQKTSLPIKARLVSIVDLRNKYVLKRIMNSLVQNNPISVVATGNLSIKASESRPCIMDGTK